MEPKLEKSVAPFRYSAKKRWTDSLSMVWNGSGAFGFIFLRVKLGKLWNVKLGKPMDVNGGCGG